MPGLYEIEFLPEGQVVKFAGSRGNYYELQDGGHIDVHTEPAWCRKCGDLSEAERIESLEEIDKQLADLHDPTSFAYRAYFDNLLHELTGKGDEVRQKRIVELRERRRWRESRKSPPKCIECGSTDVLPLHGEPVPHPRGHGTLTLRCVGMCSTDFNEWFFTPEGDRIARDTKPTHWHHPALDDELNKPGGAVEWLRRTGRLGASGGEPSDE